MAGRPTTCFRSCVQIFIFLTNETEEIFFRHCFKEIPESQTRYHIVFQHIKAQSFVKITLFHLSLDKWTCVFIVVPGQQISQACHAVPSPDLTKIVVILLRKIRVVQEAVKCFVSSRISRLVMYSYETKPFCSSTSCAARYLA